MRKRPTGQGSGQRGSKAAAPLPAGGKTTKKKSRTPKAYLAPQGGDVEDELVQDAGEMVDQPSDEEEQQQQQQQEGQTDARQAKHMANPDGGAAHRSSADFLLRLNERQISQ